MRFLNKLTGYYLLAKNTYLFKLLLRIDVRMKNYILNEQLETNQKFKTRKKEMMMVMGNIFE